MSKSSTIQKNSQFELVYYICLVSKTAVKAFFLMRSVFFNIKSLSYKESGSYNNGLNTTDF